MTATALPLQWLRSARTRVGDLRVLAVAAVTVVVMWPTDPIQPGTTLDPAWKAALGMARVAGLHFGSDVAFTYGPLGFAVVPSGVSRSGLVISLLLIPLLSGTFAICTFRLLQRRLDDARLAAVATVVLGCLAPNSGSLLCELVVISLVATMIDVMLRRLTTPRWTHVGLGVVAAVLLLSKVTTGTTLIVTSLVFALAMPDRWRRGALALGSFVVAVLVLWLLLGQRLSDLGTWLVNSQDSGAAYQWAMNREVPTRHWEYLVAAAAVVVLLTLVARTLVQWRRTPDDDRSPLVTLVALHLVGALMFFLVFKEGFVRHDAHSFVFFFAVLYFLATMTTWRVGTSWRVTIVATTALAVMASTLVSDSPSLADSLDPSSAARALTQVVNQVVSPSAWTAANQDAKARNRAAYQLPEFIVGALRGQTVHIDSTEASLAWTYDLVWNPTPTLQRYVAYTERLDRMDAEHLLADDGPERVLRQASGTIDGRFDLMDAPQEMMAMLCGFDPIEQTDEWLVLTKAPDRCSRPVEVGSATVQPGEALPVPTIDSTTQALLVQVDFDISLADRAQAFLFKVDPFTIRIDDASYRIIPTTANEPGLLYVPPSSGWNDTFRRLTAPPRTLTLDHAATVRFFTVDI